MLQQAVHVQPERLLVGLSQTQDSSRLALGWTWATFNPTGPALDANEYSDQDGNWDCSGATCEYTPYTNFMESMQLQILTWIHLIQSDYLAKHGKDYRSQNGGNLEPSLSA